MALCRGFSHFTHKETGAKRGPGSYPWSWGWCGPSQVLNSAPALPPLSYLRAIASWKWHWRWYAFQECFGKELYGKLLRVCVKCILWKIFAQISESFAAKYICFWVYFPVNLLKTLVLSTSFWSGICFFFLSSVFPLWLIAFLLVSLPNWKSEFSAYK